MPVSKKSLYESSCTSRSSGIQAIDLSSVKKCLPFISYKLWTLATVLAFFAIASKSYKTKKE
jgi:hypothetical protein